MILKNAVLVFNVAGLHLVYKFVVKWPIWI